MSSQTVLRSVAGLLVANLGLTGYHFYNTDSKLERNYEEMEARMDELEGTLRGHIGLIEDSLQRIEETTGKSGWGKGMSKKGEEMYTQRGKDDRKK